MGRMNTLPLALFGDVGGGELLVVFAAILLLFGGKRLPSIARTVGRTLADLRKASQDFKDQALNADASPAEPSGHGTALPPPPEPGSTPPAKSSNQEPPPRDLAG